MMTGGDGAASPMTKLTEGDCEKDKKEEKKRNDQLRARLQEVREDKKALLQLLEELEFKERALYVAIFGRPHHCCARASVHKPLH